MPCTRVTSSNWRTGSASDLRNYGTHHGDNRSPSQERFSDDAHGRRPVTCRCELRDTSTHSDSALLVVNEPICRARPMGCADRFPISGGIPTDRWQRRKALLETQLKMLYALVAILIGIIVAITAGILKRSDGESLANASLYAGGAFVASVTVTLALMSTAGLV